ncbi:MAG: hypothetical protein COA85_05175 [Robiginitomaculum sp.]|nr:MAG: hypothetical protein COA85_05175 [Robiginitomaculum sp.]
MRHLLAVFGILAMGTPAMADGSNSKCVRTYELRDFQSLDDYHVLITGRTLSEMYLVTMRRSCRDIDFSSRLITTFANRRVCPPFIEHIQSEDDLCAVKWIQEVSSRDEAKALASEDMKARATAKAEKKARKHKTDDDS